MKNRVVVVVDNFDRPPRFLELELELKLEEEKRKGNFSWFRITHRVTE